MKLYGHPLSSCTRKVLVTAAEVGATIELSVVDLFVAEQKQASHLARHPFGVVPVLEDDGFSLYESRAIIRHLARRPGGEALVPTAPREVALMDQWLSVDQSYVAPHTRTLAVERIVKPHAGAEPDRAAESAAEAALESALRVVDEALARTPYLAGDTFSLADVSLMPYVASLPMIRAETLARGRRHLERWWTAVAARPSWQRTVA